ncbi:MAG: TlpA disulfide reductase family protein [Eubacteriales bacterium]
MKRKIWLLVKISLLVIIVLYFYNYYNGTINSSPENTNQDTVTNTSELNLAENFTLTDSNGNQVSLTDFRGKNVYINFWASWCGPCKSEMPDIQKISQEYKDDLIVLAVNVGDSQNTVQDFITQNNYDFTVLLDTNMDVARQYQITTIPVSIFINKDGVIISKRIGAISESQMKSYIEKL